MPAAVKIWSPAREISHTLTHVINIISPCFYSVLVDVRSVKRIHAIEDSIEDMKSSIEGMKSSIEDIFAISKDSKIPYGLLQVIKETFKCSICHCIPIKPPLIVTKCCKYIILGCDECTKNWYKGEDALTKQCPRCKAERGFSDVMVLRGIDDFLQKIDKLAGDVTSET
jgi:hypothetical protein